MVNLTHPGLLDTAITHLSKNVRGNAVGKRRRVMQRKATRHGLWFLWTCLELCPDSEFRCYLKPGSGDWGYKVSVAAFHKKQVADT